MSGERLKLRAEEKIASGSPLAGIATEKDKLDCLLRIEALLRALLACQDGTRSASVASRRSPRPSPISKCRVGERP